MAAAVRELKEELRLLHEPGSYVGEVIKLMSKKKILVKVPPALAAEGDSEQWFHLDDVCEFKA